MRTDEVVTAPSEPAGGEHDAEPARIDYASVFPTGVRAMIGLQRAVETSGLEPLLLELVKMRASQINGCAYCLDMHSKDARALGESEQRLHLLAAWREAPCYDTRERAALAWCEDLTLIAQHGTPDADYEKLEQAFLPAEIVALTLAIVAINGWNRLAISMRVPVGPYVSPHRSTASASAAGEQISPPNTHQKELNDAHSTT
jgi:AhpD family alkylhydroperoxidase